MITHAGVLPWQACDTAVHSPPQLHTLDAADQRVDYRPPAPELHTQRGAEATVWNTGTLCTSTPHAQRSGRRPSGFRARCTPQLHTQLGADASVWLTGVLGARTPHARRGQDPRVEFRQPVHLNSTRSAGPARRAPTPEAAPSTAPRSGARPVWQARKEDRVCRWRPPGRRAVRAGVAGRARTYKPARHGAHGRPTGTARRSQRVRWPIAGSPEGGYGRGSAKPRTCRLSPGRPCQRYPPFVPRQLSPAVDNFAGRSPQMWTTPGEIDVDKHSPSHLYPLPVEECGFPVEGSGDDESVASRRYPQAGGQTRWTSGG